jgi:hypothetical protein
MRAALGIRGAAVAFATLVVAAAWACDPIGSSTASHVPVNDCTIATCSLYEGNPQPSCSAGRCVHGKPQFAYVLVVDVPTTSFYAAGSTFVLRSQDHDKFIDTSGKCPPLSCWQLPVLAQVTTSLAVTQSAATALAVNVGTTDPQPLGIATTFFALSPDAPAMDASDHLAVDVGLFVPNVIAGITASDQTVIYPQTLAYVPPGRWQRSAVPADSGVPPIITPLTIAANKVLSDEIVVGKDPNALDVQPDGPLVPQISRNGGLDGFSIWLEDQVTRMRVSSARALTGETDAVRLDTVNQNVLVTPANGNAVSVLRKLDAVVAPPSATLALPTYRNGTENGAIAEVTFPALVPPAPLTGQVTDEVGANVSASIVFDGQSIAPVAPDTPDTALKYRTSVDTNGSGAFATVLPPGVYDVTVIPSVASGRARLFAHGLQIQPGAVVTSGGGKNACAGTPVRCTFSVPKKSVVTGRVVVGLSVPDANKPPLAGATVLALPSAAQDGIGNKRTSPWLFPREAHATTADDGTFTLAADEGLYDIVIVPRSGTGYPRALALRTKIGPSTDGDAGADAGAGTDLGTIKVGAPSVLSFSVQDPSNNPLRQTVVRLFAHSLSDTVNFYELGEGLTNDLGQVEVLIGPQPP